MKLISFMLMNIDSVLLVIALFAAFIVLYINGEKKILNVILFAAVTEAERQYKSGTGILKKAFVTAKIYSIIPTILRIFITESQIGKWIEAALTYAKQKWAENPSLAEYVAADTITEDAGEEADSKPPGGEPDDIDFYGH